MLAAGGLLTRSLNHGYRIIQWVACPVTLLEDYAFGTVAVITEWAAVGALTAAATILTLPIPGGIKRERRAWQPKRIPNPTIRASPRCARHNSGNKQSRQESGRQLPARHRDSNLICYACANSISGWPQATLCRHSIGATEMDSVSYRGSPFICIFWLPASRSIDGCDSLILADHILRFHQQGDPASYRGSHFG